MIERGILRPVLPEIDGGGRGSPRWSRRERAARDRARSDAPAGGAAAGRSGRRGVGRGAAAAVEAAGASGSSRRAEPTLDAPEPLAYRHRRRRGDRPVPAARRGQAPSLEALEGWQRPRLPVSGGDLIARGLAAGPMVAATLQAIEREWVRAAFPATQAVARSPPPRRSGVALAASRPEPSSAGSGSA